MRIGQAGFLVAATLTLATPTAWSQGTYRTSASPPDAADLARLNLKTEWTANVPLQSGRDGVATVQVVDATQVFVQTQSGLLVALDAVTGAKQWAYRYPAAYSTSYPVGVNEDFVFAVNVARLICFSRVTGVVEFDFELPGSATVGPVADKELVYVTLNGTRLIAYTFPQILRPVAKSRPEDAGLTRNPADSVAGRYGTAANFTGLKDEAFTRLYLPQEPKSDIGLYTGQKSPSISALPSVTPPYTLDNRGLYVTPSVVALPTLRQPYSLKPDYLRYNQRTPSISVLPPSVARAAELANFRPRGVEPKIRWTHTSGRRYTYPPVLTDNESVTNLKDSPATTRLWATTDGAVVEAIDKRTQLDQVTATLQDAVSSPLTGPVPVGTERLGFVGLRDGTVVALNLLQGGPQGPRVEWRAGVGGSVNRRPVAARDAVFASGEQAGTTKIDIATGEVVWKSELGADRFVAANDEFVYLKDRAGRLAIYDRQRPTDAAARRSLALAKLDLPGFGVDVANDKSDRLFLASDNGLVVCLRDASLKYARPVPLIAPPAPAAAIVERKEPTPPAVAPPSLEPKADAPAPKKNDAKKDDDAKKDAPKKDTPKKDDDAKMDAPKKDGAVPKKDDEPKMDAPKKDGALPKKDGAVPKKEDEPKMDAPKKDAPKMEMPKKDEPKKDESKKE